MAHFYEDSDDDSNDNNKDSYGKVFDSEKRKNIKIGSDKNFSATDKYNIAKVNNNLLNDF